MNVLSSHRRAAVLTIVLAALAGCSGARQPTRPASTSSPTESTEASPSPAQSAKALLFPSSDGLWFYPVGAKSSRRIAGSGPDSWGWGFALKNANEATYFYKGKLREFDARKGTTRVLAKAPGGFAMDWSPNGSLLAYMTVDFDRCSCATAYLYSPGGAPRVLWKSRSWAGRGGSQLDETSIAWSPDGTTLLVVVTPLDTAVDGDKIITADTIYVLRMDGSETLRSRLGTMARWSPDGRSIYYRRSGSSASWRILTVADGKEKTLGLPSDAYRPRVSPDGAMIAYDDGKEHPSVFVFNLASDTKHLIGKNYVAPVWLSARSLATGKTTLCGNCEGPQWKPAGYSTRWRLDRLDAPKPERMPIGSIGWGADVAFN